jgi:hypothetical protein
MKKIFCCLFFACYVISASSQQVYLITGKVLSSFDYKDSEGNTPGDMKGTSQNSLGLGVRTSIFKSAWNISFEAANDKFGATCSDQLLGNYSEWDVSYLGLNLGIDYEFFKPNMFKNEREGFSFYLKGIFATDLLLNGKQRLNNQVFDLAGVEEFDKPVLFLKGGSGVRYYITRNYVAFAQYMFGRSILPGNYNKQEKLNFITHSVSLGFSVSLFSRGN